jgi:hypothetical protein
MVFKLGPREPDTILVCDACGERVAYHWTIRTSYARIGPWEHDECLRALEGRPKGTLRLEKP